MGKGKKDKKHDGGGKSGKPPKSAGGVKIPKPLRKAGKEALKLAREPVVSEVVAAALLSAAAALRGDKAANKAKSAAADAGGEAFEGTTKQASKIGDSLRVLAIDLAKRTLESWERPASEKGGGKGREGNKDG